MRGATVKRFAFEDSDDLERLLREGSTAPRLICIDGVNSMTGNAADLPAFARLAREYDALLYVDDAHGFGVIGERADDELSPYGKRGQQHRAPLRRELRQRRARRGSLEGVLVAAAFLACPPELKQPAEDGGAAVPLLGPVAGRLARDRARGLRRQRAPRRRDPGRPLAEDGRRARLPRPARRPHAQPLRVPDHRGAARATRGHRRRRALPVRERHLRDARRLPARPERRGRLPHPAHRREHRRRGRAAHRRPRPSRRARFDLQPARREGERPRDASLRDLARERAGGWYLAVACALAGALPVRAAVQGQRAAVEPPRPLGRGRDRRRDPAAQAAGASARGGSSPPGSSSSSAATSTPTATRSSRPTSVPVAGRRALPRRVPGADGRPARARPAAEPAPRPRRR